MEKQQLRVACEHAAAQRDVPRVAREAGVSKAQIHALMARGHLGARWEVQLRDALIRLGYLRAETVGVAQKKPTSIIGVIAQDLEALAALLVDKRLPLEMRINRWLTQIEQYHRDGQSIADAMRSETQIEE